MASSVPNNVYLDGTQTRVNMDNFVNRAEAAASNIKTKSASFINTYIYPILIVIPLIILILIVTLSKKTAGFVKISAIILIIFVILMYILSRYNIDLSRMIKKTT